MTATLPDRPTLDQRAPSVAQQADALAIQSDADLECATELGHAIKALRDEAEAHHRPLIAAALDTHRKALAALAKIDEPLNRAEIILKSKIGEYLREKLAAEAREQQRLLDIESARRARDTEEAIEQAEAAGATVAEVEAIIEQAERQPMVAPVVAPMAKPTGLATPKKPRYKGEVTDKLTLVRWIAANPNFLYLLGIEEGKLNQLANAQGSLLKIPGVRVTEAPAGAGISFRR